MTPSATVSSPMLRHTIQLEFDHRVVFTRDVFDPGNDLLGKLLAEGGMEMARALVLVDSGVADGIPDIVEKIKSFAESPTSPVDLVDEPLVIAGGEPAKNRWEYVERIWSEINRHGLDRHAFVFAVGGGAFQDLTGFAASTAHRGIRHIRFPTTTLSQGDGGVGVKNGVNFFGKKNWVGTFSVPFAVVNDLAFLEPLPEREKRAGIIEAIKVSLIRDRKFFENLEESADRLRELEPEALEYAIRKSAELHVEHIATAGDPFELGSARPLDFGHWVAHKLEQVSEFAVNHGEAVAIGMAVDVLYSVYAGLISSEEGERILSLIEQVGFETWHPCLQQKADTGNHIILEGLEEFREHLGGELTVTLVPEIGRKLEVHEMDSSLILKAISSLLNRRSNLQHAATVGNPGYLT